MICWYCNKKIYWFDSTVWLSESEACLNKKGKIDYMHESCWHSRRAEIFEKTKAVYTAQSSSIRNSHQTSH